MSVRKWTALAAVLGILLCLEACEGMTDVSGSRSEPEGESSAPSRAASLHREVTEAIDKVEALDGISAPGEMRVRIDDGTAALTQTMRFGLRALKKIRYYNRYVTLETSLMGQQRTLSCWCRDGVKYVKDGEEKTRQFYSTQRSTYFEDLKALLPESAFEGAELQWGDGEQTVSLVLRGPGLEAWLPLVLPQPFFAGDTDGCTVEGPVELSVVVGEDGYPRSWSVKLSAAVADGESAMALDLDIAWILEQPGEPVTVEWPNGDEYPLVRPDDGN